jgi:CRP-like cAMP-binding protein
METPVLYDTLRASPLTANLDDDQCRVLAEIAYERRLDGDQVLIGEGLTDCCFHVIVDGTLAVTKDAGGGEWTTLALLRPGDLAGELGFVTGRPHSATLRAVGETRVLSFDRGEVEALLDQHPWVVYRLMQTIVQAVHQILRRMNTQYVEMANYITKQHGRY